MYQVLAAIVTALVMICITVFYSKVFSARLLAATMLCAIAFIYVGFALKDNPVNLLVLEVAAALGFYFFALVGFIKNAQLIGYGIILHGVWDILHHRAVVIKTDVFEQWPMYCMIVDVIYGVYFVIISKNVRLTE